MAFTGRSRDTIRASLLSYLAAQYAARGETLLVSVGSDAYLWASALAVQLEAIEAQAEQVTADILPDQASTEALDRHAYVDGIARAAGFTARHTVTVSSAIAGTYPITAGTRMAYSDGTLYLVESASVTTSGGSPVGTITVRAAAAGSVGTRAVTDTLTFVATPTGLNATGSVAFVVRHGTDAELDASLATRIIARRRDRPGSGNRADWRDWVKSYTGTEITEAYVYPLLAPPSSFPGAGTAATPGTLTVVAVGPAQGDSYTNTRIVPTDDASARATPGSELTRIEDYIEGNRLPDGTDVSDNPNDALRSAVVTPGNYSVEQINVTSQDVLLTVAVTTSNAEQWSGTMTVSSSTSTELVVTGNHIDKVGYRALVEVAAGALYRGNFKMFTLGGASFDGFDTTFTIDADSVLAYATGTVYPCVANFPAIRTAVLAYFDSLGPGDTTPASRWPTEDDGGRSTVYRTALAAAAIAVDGVLSATTTTPAGDVTPAAKHVITLGDLRVTQ